MPKPIVLDPKILADIKDQESDLSKNITFRFLETMLGQVYCEDACVFLATIPSESVDMVFTDEYYGIEGSSAIAFRDNTRKPYAVTFDFDKPLPAHLMMPWVLEASRILKQGGVLINCGIESWATSYQNIVEWSGLEMRQQGVWIKTNPPTRVRHGGWKSAHERIWVASKGSLNKRMKKVPQAYLNNWVIETSCPHCETQFPVTWSHNYNLTDGEWADDVFVAPYKAHTDRIGHPNEKPDWLAAYYLHMLTNEGDIVVDPFAGSGAFVVQAAKMGRRVIANDFNETYAGIIRDRLASLQVKMF